MRSAARHRSAVRPGAVPPADPADPAEGARARRRGTLAALLAAPAILVAGAGCASLPPVQEPGAVPSDRLALVSDPAAAVPSDFAVDVLVRLGDRRDRGDAVHERPFRVALSADGSVHAALEDDPSAGTPPVRIRTVDRATVAEVWTEARALGLLDPDLPAPPVHPGTVRPEPDQLVAIVDVRAEGRRRSVVERVGGPQRLAPELAAFVRTLAELAWATDRPDAGVRVVPRRYDLGPDPYARYREPAAAADRGGA